MVWLTNGNPPLIQDRTKQAASSLIGVVGLIMFEVLLVKSSKSITFTTLLASWIFVASGFNLSTACAFSLLSKKLPGEWNGRVSMAVQCSNLWFVRRPSVTTTFADGSLTRAAQAVLPGEDQA